MPPAPGAGGAGEPPAGAHVENLSVTGHHHRNDLRITGQLTDITGMDRPTKHIRARPTSSSTGPVSGVVELVEQFLIIDHRHDLRPVPAGGRQPVAGQGDIAGSDQ
ncbi:hypothetical protein, partial [Arthrobacter pigmenti]